MIRFRFTEDEQRYLQLRSEVYRILAQHLPPQFVSQAMRNFGKLEQMVYFDGVRQGFAAAELAQLMHGHPAMPQARHLKAFQAHAAIYGSTDTPLHQVEDEHLLNMNQPETSTPWLDRQPMRYAPETLSDWEAEQSEHAVMMPDDNTSFPEFIDKLKSADPNAVPYIEGQRPQSLEAFRASQDSTVIPFDNPIVSEPQPPQSAPEDDRPAESPMFLDRVRDHLTSSGARHETWKDLIFNLHLGMGVDAGYLDLALSSPQGLTVLAQCNHAHLHPGAEMNLQDLPKSDS